MWSYYGRKSKIVKYYPKPKYNLIIEPFAGTAVYSLYQKNWEKQVILIDKYKDIIDIWKYLIQAKEKDIMNLPSIKKGDDIRKFTQLIKEERMLMGFWINRGSNAPKNIVTEWASKGGYWEKKKKEMATNLHKIRHWKIFYNEYINIPNKEATWFIDPPYQFGGELYIESNKNINYQSLANYCKTRKGQIIVCENSKANWLDFKPLIELQGQSHKTMESIWYKDKEISCDLEQCKKNKKGVCIGKGSPELCPKNNDNSIFEKEELLKEDKPKTKEIKPFYEE